MLSGDINYNKKNDNNNRDSSSSSITCSAPSVSVSVSVSVSLGAKTMEEIWKDITFLQDQSVMTPRPRITHNHQHHHLHNNPDYALQEFLARPFNRDPPSTVVHGASHSASPVSSLNSCHGYDSLEPNEHLRVSNASALANPFETLGSSSNGLPCFGKKNVQESNNGSADRRNKRMIKNRESAARSRARKQAYTNELELEVAQLMEENARLKRQQELCLAAAAAAQIPRKHTLHRTSTAPF